MLSRLLDGRIAWTPDKDAGIYRFAGRVKFDRLLNGIVFTRGMASQSVPSWNQILSFLHQMAQLRESAGSAA